jgi:hypothetical protein
MILRAVLEDPTADCFLTSFWQFEVTCKYVRSLRGFHPLSLLLRRVTGAAFD